MQNKPIKPQILEYDSLDEKRSEFDFAKYYKVDRDIDKFITDLITWNQEFKDLGKNLFFRGVNEAKYMMFNTAQRCYINNIDRFKLPLYFFPNFRELRNRHYDTFIQFMIEETISSEDEQIKKFLENNNIKQGNILAYMSFMQHYGIPTPLLDFTSNPFMALFFAIDGYDNTSEYKDNEDEILNYISLYLVQDDAYILQHIRQLYYPDFIKYMETLSINYIDLAKSRLHLLLHSDAKYQIINNQRIVNQEGLFIYNSHEFSPLEYQFEDASKTLLPKMVAKGFVDHNTASTFYHQIGACFNIHKKLIPRILEILESKGIKKEIIYPDLENKIDSNEIIERVIQRLNKTKIVI